jgi:hypothetical protein
MAAARSRYTATDDQSPQVNHVADRVADGFDGTATATDQPGFPDVADVADIAADRPDRVCTVCGDPLDQALIDAGFTDHGEEAWSRSPP